jgi:hypothetical protein
MPAHLARCASAILRREAAEIIRFGWVDLPDVPVPFNDSIPEIIWFNFSTSDSARSRLSKLSKRIL